MNQLSKRHFWEWFKRHSQEYLGLKNKSKKEALYWLNELKTHLRAYYKFLDFVMVWDNDQSCTLTITVNGKSRHFRRVDDLVKKSFAIPGWKFEALEGPREIDFLLEEAMEETGIDPSELYFSLDTTDEDGTIIKVYHPLVTDKNADSIEWLSRKAIYNLIGERSYGTELCWGGLTNLSFSNGIHVEKLEELPSLLGQSKSAILVDRNGRLVL